MVLISVKDRKPLYLLGAIFIHSGADFLCAYSVVQEWPIWILQAFGAILACLSLAYIIYLKINMDKFLPPVEEDLPEPSDDARTG